MNFEVFGPFPLERHGKKQLITKESIGELARLLEERREGLAGACGCYVFAKRAGKGITPWYVGQACKRPILKEALNADNIEKYNRVLDRRGSPLLFVLPALTPTGKLRRRPENASLSTLNFLERWLIATALDRNPRLINNKETRFLRSLHVVGIFNATRGESTTDAKVLCDTLGL